MLLALDLTARITPFLIIFSLLLFKTRDENSDGHNPEPCPICQRELGVEWSVMHCGHCYCLDCMNILLERYSFGGRNRVVKCAICREITYRSDVSFVSTKKCSNDKDIQDFNIKVTDNEYLLFIVI